MKNKNFSYLLTLIVLLMHFAAMPTLAGGSRGGSYSKPEDPVQAAKNAAYRLKYYRVKSDALKVITMFPIRPYDVANFDAAAEKSMNSNPLKLVSILDEMFKASFTGSMGSGLRIEPNLVDTQAGEPKSWFSITLTNPKTDRPFHFYFPKDLTANSIPNFYRLELFPTALEMHILIATDQLPRISGVKHSTRFTQLILKFVPAVNLRTTFDRDELLDQKLIRYQSYYDGYWKQWRQETVSNLLLREITIKQGNRLPFLPFWESTGQIPIETVEDVLWHQDRKISKIMDGTERIDVSCGKVFRFY